MGKAELKLGTHTVIKTEDINKYLSDGEKELLLYLLDMIDCGRDQDGKTFFNKYYVVNQDEPYAQEVLDLILTREGEKNDGL